MHLTTKKVDFAWYAPFKLYTNILFHNFFIGMPVHILLKKRHACFLLSGSEEQASAVNTKAPWSAPRWHGWQHF